MTLLRAGGVVAVGLWLILDTAGQGQVPSVNSVPLMPQFRDMPSPELMNERQQMMLATLSKVDARVDDVERSVIGHGRQLAIIETALWELQWAARAILATLIGQLGLFMMQQRRR